MAAQGDPQPTGPFLRLELKPREERAWGGFESPQGLRGEQRAKVSPGSQGSTAAPPVNVQRGQLLHRQGHSTHKESSFMFFPSLLGLV